MHKWIIEHTIRSEFSIGAFKTKNIIYLCKKLIYLSAYIIISWFQNWFLIDFIVNWFCVLFSAEKKSRIWRDLDLFLFISSIFLSWNGHCGLLGDLSQMVWPESSSLLWHILIFPTSIKQWVRGFTAKFTALFNAAKQLAETQRATNTAPALGQKEVLLYQCALW